MQRRTKLIEPLQILCKSHQIKITFISSWEIGILQKSKRINTKLYIAKTITIYIWSTINYLSKSDFTF